MACCEDVAMVSMSCCVETPVDVSDPIPDLPAVQTAKFYLFCAFDREDPSISHDADLRISLHSIEMHNLDTSLFSNKIYQPLQSYLI